MSHGKHSRRQWLGGALATGLAGCLLKPLRADGAEEVAKSSLGLVIYDAGIRRRWMQQASAGFDLFEPLTFLRHCHEVGAGGMQAALGTPSRDAVDKLRSFAEANGLSIEAIIRPPESESDVGRFEAEVRSATEVGSLTARTVIMPGRRYERFQTLDEFREFEKRGLRMLELAAPIVEKHRLPLAVENHKDQRIDERVALYEHLQSSFVGACVDTGNSFALLDDPYGAVEALAPYAFSVHLKDQSLREYEEGFLLGDIPLGQGSFDLKRMVEAIRKVKPQVRFSLELITRDALKVPCLTEGYWATMPQVSGKALAATLSFVREHPPRSLQTVSSLPFEDQVALEDSNVSESLTYAREQLGLV